MENKGYTQDGSVDLRGRPVLASKTGGWKACGFLLAYSAFDSMVFYSVASNLVVYLTEQLHDNMVNSVRNASTWIGMIWVTPIIGAYIADTYLGRFWTFFIASLIHLLGMVLLTIGVAFKLFPSLKDRMIFFYVALYIIAIGTGGTKPNIMPFGADQFDDLNPDEQKLKSSFFNWWMFGYFFGAFFSSIDIYVQQSVGWGIGYAIPTIGIAASLIAFYIGVPFYRHKMKKAQSPMSEIFMVIKKAFANRHKKISDDSVALYEFETQHYLTSSKRQLQHSDNFKFLDKAALRDSSMPCTITQVEAVKLFLRMFFVWLTTLIPATMFTQVNTFFVKQGLTLDRSIGPNFKIPPASLGVIIVIAILICVPLYDKFFVPFMRRRTKNPRGISLLQRFGTGMFLLIFVMIVSCFTERTRMQVIKSHGIKSATDVVPMSIFWLLPQYVIFGISDVFSLIGMMEFFYDQAPEGMQSLGTAFFTSSLGVGNFLNSLLVTAIDEITRKATGKSWLSDNLNDSRLDYYYAFLILLTTLNLVVYVCVASWFNYKKEVHCVAEKNGKEIEGMEV
ncbi:hypothetical protein LUZ60_009609 [Juncus effusus]|nr:hypothetical protein LUZ60_009609 [Juncus effusus]